MKGYKVFDKDWKCKYFQYELGKTYELEGELKICKNGFHFCEKLVDCFNYYKFNPMNKVAEIEAIGDIVSDDNSKYCTNKITIVKELTWYEVLDMVNTGKGNSGYGNTGNGNSGNGNSGNGNSGNGNSGNGNSRSGNTGNYNSGDWNTGDRNSGHYNAGNNNSGYCNTGDMNNGSRNTGNWNSGNLNTGDYNAGYRNTGDGNTGDYNTGDYNTGDYNSGFFNLKTPNVRLFDHETDLTFDSYKIKRLNKILFTCPKYYKCNEFINNFDMTEEEKESHPEYKTIGGYLKLVTNEDTIDEDRREWWEELNIKDKEFIKSLPYYDEDIFFECVGIKKK